jgi:hypothetical protein
MLTPLSRAPQPHQSRQANSEDKSLQAHSVLVLVPTQASTDKQTQCCLQDLDSKDLSTDNHLSTHPSELLADPSKASVDSPEDPEDLNLASQDDKPF